MRSSPMKRVFVATWLLASIVAPCLAAAPASSGDREVHVLILNGTDPYQPEYLAIDSAMRASLANHGAERIVLFSESLDAQLFTEDALDAENFALLAKKYRSLHINVIDVVSRAALEFFQRHGSRLWPGARIVYQGFLGETVDRSELPPNAIEIAPRNDVGATIDMARRMQPNARRVVVVAGASDIDKRREQLARKRLATLNIPEVEFLSGLPSPELIAKIAAEPTDSIVLYLAQFRDRDGRPYRPQEDLSQITRISRAPIYATIESYFGSGVLGGTMESYARRGRMVAEEVQAAIAGKPLDPSRVLLAAPSRCIVDARALRHWSLDARRLPAGCEIRFAELPYWREHPGRVAAILAIILSEAALITALLVELWRRRVAERALQRHLIETTHASRLALAGELTASIAHEIKQPLAAILSNAETAEVILLSDQNLRNSLPPILADIRRDDIRASEVIRRLRALLAKHEVEHHPTDLNAIVADVCALLRSEADRRKVRIEIVQDSVAQIMGDRIQIQQVLINLIMNAMDAVANVSEDRRTICVSVASSEQHSTVTVSDLGQGIRSSELHKVFNSFYSTKHSGMGLGLSIARAIVEAHGGRIWVDSRAGRGSEFHTSFPALASAMQDLHTTEAS
ncbi:MAG TPA: HAMP domain-containing sensor histidine kinase [Steroidobacteraceae bacterium]